ncbi:Nucleolar protein NOP52 variant, partial [Tolypocladium capitatum]
AGDAVAAVLRVLRDACFAVADDRAVALGLRLHVLDLCVDELAREGLLAAAPDPGLDAARAAFVRAVGDMLDALRRSPVKSVRARAAEAYEDERLPWGTKPAADAADDDDDDDDGEDEGWGGIED